MHITTMKGEAETMTLLTKISGCAAVAALAITTAGAALAGDSTGKKTPSAVPANKSELNDAQILGVADVANTGEVEQANIALTRARSDKVKSFAELMVKDHTAAKNKGLTVAKQLGVTPATSAKSAEVQKQGAEAMKTLHEADADDFDKTYLKTQIRMHEDTLKLLDNDLIPKANTPQVKSLLTEMRGHVQHHLAVAHSDLDTLNK
jgi:putative membrane protein